MQAEFDSADSFLATPLFMPDEDAGTNISERECRTSFTPDSKQCQL